MCLYQAILLVTLVCVISLLVKREWVCKQRLLASVQTVLPAALQMDNPVSVKLVSDDAMEPASGLWINLGGDRSVIRDDHTVYIFMVVQPMVQMETNKR